MRGGIKAKMVFIWVCQRSCECVLGLMLSTNIKKQSLPTHFPQIQHSTIIDPSLQLTASFVPNQFLSPSPVPRSVSLSFSLSLSAFPFLRFSHYPRVSLAAPLPHTLLPHTLRSQGSLPPRWFVNSSLRRNQYFINKPQRAFALILYDLCGKGLRASISSSGLLPKLCC